jgi:hypothetical protein
MHSMPASAVHEAMGWAAYQSMDNQILLYGVSQESGYKVLHFFVPSSASHPFLCS